ncbi:MAG TPA: hypothetical protein VFI28_11055 [Candidatus Limnocylindrales bacterium]|nr:hypothetical protein [Candidatus Limnocylindrales bacterium]
MITSAHAWLAAGTAVACAALLLGAVSLRFGSTGARFLVDRAILVGVALVAIDALVGIALLAVGHAPMDLLHVVYGGVALVVLPAARWAGRSSDLRRRALWVAAGCVVLLGVLLRLAQTG